MKTLSYKQVLLATLFAAVAAEADAEADPGYLAGYGGYGYPGYGGFGYARPLLAHGYGASGYHPGGKFFCENYLKLLIFN